MIQLFRIRSFLKNYSLLRKDESSIRIHDANSVRHLYSHLPVDVMKEYIINALDSDGNVEDRPYPFQLEDSATVLSLKEAFEKKSVYTSDQFRLFYRKENGQNIGKTFLRTLKYTTNYNYFFRP